MCEASTISMMYVRPDTISRGRSQTKEQTPDRTGVKKQKAFLQKILKRHTNRQEGNSEEETILALAKKKRMNLENPTAEEKQKYYAFYEKGIFLCCGTQGSAGARIIRRNIFGNNQRNSRKGRCQYPQPFPTSFTGKQKVSPATIQKIEALIKEVGYVQKRGLRVLNNEKSQLIAVVINYHKEFKDSILGDPFYGKIIGFIEEYVQKQGYYLMLYSTKDIEEIFFRWWHGWDVDGVIAISFSRHNCEKNLSTDQKPIVSIDAYGNTSQRQPSGQYRSGDESGGYQMVKYLLECGYEHIKVCAGRDNGVDHLRYVGAQRAMQECAAEGQKLQFVARHEL